MIGTGTLVNVLAVCAGSLLGVWLGQRMRAAQRNLITDVLGLVTLLIAGKAAVTVFSPEISTAVGANKSILLVLACLILGGLIGSLLQITEKLNSVGSYLEKKASKSAVKDQKFVTGFVTATLVFCVGPLTLLGSLSEGMGLGSDQLLLKSALDFFASIAFAAALGIGVAASAVAVLIIQGSLTLLGVWLGGFLSAAQIATTTAVGGLILVLVGLQLLEIKNSKAADLLPAIVFAPVLTWLLSLLQ